MILTRKQRTKVFREQVEDEWKEKFWKFIEDNLEQPWNWSYLSSNLNITFDILNIFDVVENFDILITSSFNENGGFS